MTTGRINQITFVSASPPQGGKRRSGSRRSVPSLLESVLTVGSEEFASPVTVAFPLFRCCCCFRPGRLRAFAVCHLFAECRPSQDSSSVLTPCFDVYATRSRDRLLLSLACLPEALASRPGRHSVAIPPQEVGSETLLCFQAVLARSLLPT